jgi:hypothetical protein
LSTYLQERELWALSGSITVKYKADGTID